MADTYGVVPADIAAELPGMFPGGFTVSTKPTLAQVVNFITTADLIVSIAVQNVAGAVPSASDRLAPLAKRIIADKVKAQVIRIVFTGNDVERVDAAAAPFERSAKDALDALTSLDAQASGEGDPVNRIMVGNTTPTRDLIICDEDLNPGPSGYGSGRYGQRRQGQF